jgi:hypothetical protein
VAGVVIRAHADETTVAGYLASTVGVLDAASSRPALLPASLRLKAVTDREVLVLVLDAASVAVTVAVTVDVVVPRFEEQYGCNELSTISFLAW